MKIIQKLDVIEISATDVEEALRRLVLDRTGRILDRITWVNKHEQSCIGTTSPYLAVYLNATLKPES